MLDSGEVVPEAADPVPAARPRRGLALRGVWFAYTNAPVLRHLDLEVAAGERVCVVGPTGAGKSTLLALLQRFYDPDAGAIELDGVDLRDLELGSLRGRLALVPQDPWMLDGSIADNIAFGRSWGGSGEDSPRMDRGLAEEVRAAAALCGLKALNTQIGEGGWRWPGPSSGTPRCCCWTSGPAGWTPPRSRRCSTPWTGRPRGGRCCRSRTG